jgi:hypothetical protein
MLKAARGQEVQKSAPTQKLSSPVPHYNAISLLQESDVRYLVDTIWNRQSAVSGNNNIEDLVLTRWDPSHELSPWNVILLTNLEAANHDAQVDPRDVYSPEFIRRVAQRHMNARQHFSQLTYMAKYMAKHYVEGVDGRLVPRSSVDLGEGKSSLPSLPKIDSLSKEVSLSITGVSV